MRICQKKLEMMDSKERPAPLYITHDWPSHTITQTPATV